MSPKPANCSALPAYTTITAQSFTKDGLYLAVGNDQGRLAIFKVMQILEKNQPTLIFQFEAASILDQGVNQTRFKGCINSMKTLKETLILAISRPASNEAAIVAFHWKDLIQQKSKLAWNIESSSGLLPTDVNSIDVDEIDEKLFIVGGVGASEMGKDHAVRILDVETRMETSKPLKGHCGYLHGVQFCPLNKTIATCSEDGTIRTWDHRIKQACTALLEPFKNEKLQQPKLGKWLGDVSINGDWLVTGGGPKPSIWHLRALAPTVIPDLPETCSATFVAQIIKNSDERVVLGGQYPGGLMYHFGLNGDLKAEVKTSSSCIYTVEATFQDDFKLMSVGGANSKIDLCTHNFSYADDYINFP